MQEDKLVFVQKREPPRTTRQRNFLNRPRAAICIDGVKVEVGTDIRARIDDEIAAWRPSRIDRIVLDEHLRGTTADRELDQVGLFAPDGTGHNPAAIGRPGRRAEHIHLAADRTRVAPVRIHDIQPLPFLPPHDKRDT